MRIAEKKVNLIITTDHGTIRVKEPAKVIGDRETTAIGLLNLAMVDVERGTTERARRRLVDVLCIADEIGSKPAGQSVVEVCAGMAALQGDWLRAARFFGAAEEQTSYTGINRDPADDAYLRPLIERARRTAGDDAFASAEQAGRALTYEDVIAEARLIFGDGRAIMTRRTARY